jgi:uncharacterized sodium:solute symporter family permease YidK
MLENTSTEELIAYGIVYYILYSISGLCFMIKYVRGCRECNAVPFNGSVLKGFFMLLICGLFTKIILLIGTISAFVDFFRKKD